MRFLPRHLRTFLPRHLRTVALAALACALFLIFPASPAFAHDALKRSSPAKNAELSSLKEVELEYSASVKFPFVVLHDAAGKEVALGKPVLDGPLVSAEVPQLAPGAYVVAWRVVSSDGHPIEGEIPFSVKGSSPAPSPTGGAVDVATLAAEPSTAAGEGRTASSGVPGWIWGGLAVLVVLGAFVLLRTGRRRPDRGEADAD
jgi:copper resistance protein C